MKNRNGESGAHKAACARVAARFHERWLRSYVSQKLRSDPVYPAVFELLREATQPLLDVGCGVGLLSLYLHERGVNQPMIGVDSDRRKIARARELEADVEFRAGDVREEAPEFRGNVALLDVLHYLAPEDQAELLARLANCVAPDSILIVRDCPRDGSARFWVTLLAERLAQIARWNVSVPLHFPSRESVSLGADFSRQVAPLWGRTPFNNYLFVFRRISSATAPAAER